MSVGMNEHHHLPIYDGTQSPSTERHSSHNHISQIHACISTIIMKLSFAKESIALSLMLCAIQTAALPRQHQLDEAISNTARSKSVVERRSDGLTIQTASGLATGFVNFSAFRTPNLPPEHSDSSLPRPSRRTSGFKYKQIRHPKHARKLLPAVGVSFPQSSSTRRLGMRTALRSASGHPRPMSLANFQLLYGSMALDYNRDLPASSINNLHLGFKEAKNTFSWQSNTG